METTLFWIGVGLGLYAFVLREFFQSKGLLRNRILASMLHVFFTASVGALVGFVFSASVDLQGPTPKWPILGAILGLIYGLYQATQAARQTEAVTALVADDLEWVETSFSAVLLAALIMYAVIQAFKIPSGSMEDTLHIGDHLFVNKFLYGVRIPFSDRRVLTIRDVHRGDIVVFQCPDAALSMSDREHHVHKDFIKRAIALAGDTVQVRDKHLFVNGKIQDESFTVHRDPLRYPNLPTNMGEAQYQQAWEGGEFATSREGVAARDNFGPVRVPPGSYFVMGDNRDMSFDSRFWGPMPKRLLKGKAWLVYWPPSRIKVIR